MSPSYDPASRLFFVTARETCAVYFGFDQEFKVGVQFEAGGTVRPRDQKNWGALRAIDPITAERKWEFRYPTTSASGVLSTASGLVFAGDGDGNLLAFESKTGKNLWHYQLGSALRSTSGTTYMVDGRQYLLVPSGTTLDGVRVAAALSRTTMTVPLHDVAAANAYDGRRYGRQHDESTSRVRGRNDVRRPGRSAQVIPPRQRGHRPYDHTALTTLSSAEQATLTSAERAAGWRLLFDGATTNGWRGFKKAGFPARGWSVESGRLKHAASGGQPAADSGDIITIDTFNDFDLRFEWIVAPGANSGIKYLVTE